MKAPTVRGKAFVLELKVSKEYSEMEEKCREALEQAKQGKYTDKLKREGYTDITVYGICFYRKECMVIAEE